MKVLALAAAILAFAGAASAYPCGSAKPTTAQTPILAPTVGS
jgi:hypothetical protein